MGVPAVEGERADARTVGARQEFRRGAGGLLEIGAHRSDGAARLRIGRRLLVHAAGARDRGEPHALLEHARQRRIGVAIEIEQPHHGVVAGRRQPRRRP